MSTLLGHLSQFATFFKQGELLCSQGLAYLLRTYPDARVAFHEQFAAPAGIQIDGSLTWHAEAYQDEDQGRPDRFQGCSCSALLKCGRQPRMC